MKISIFKPLRDDNGHISALIVHFNV